MALLPTVISMFVVILAQSAATSRAYAIKYGDSFEENVDLVGLGLANLGAGVSGTFVVNGSPTKTEMVDGAGGRSQLSQLTAGRDRRRRPAVPDRPAGQHAQRGPRLGRLPDRDQAHRLQGDAATSCAVRLDEFVVAAADRGDGRRSSASSRGSSWPSSCRSSSTSSTATTRTTAWSRSPRPVSRPFTPVEAGTQALPGLVIYRFGASLYYANATRFTAEILELVDKADPPLKWLCLSASAMGDVDYSGADAIRAVFEELQARGVTLVLSEVDPVVMQLLDAYGLTDKIGQGQLLRDDRRRGRGLPAGDRGDAVTEGRAVADREKAGEAARAHAPLSGVAAWRPAPDRPDPVALLEEQSATRIPDLVPVRYGRMSASPFAFYRGAALPMAADLATVPVSGLQTQLCGDAHLSNFGLFASPERDLEFDVTDFDETLVGPWEWDLLRLAASLVVSSRVRGFDAHKAQRAVRAAVGAYQSRMQGYATMRAIDVYYAKVDAAGILDFVDARARPYLRTTIKSAAHHDALHELPKITAVAGGQRRIVDRPPVIVHPKELTAPACRRHRCAIPRESPGGSPRPARSLPDRRFGVEGRRRRQRRSRGVRGPARGRRRRRPALPPGQGGRGLGPRAVPRTESVPIARRADRHRPASAAVDERHPARLDDRRTRAPPVRPPAPGRQGVGCRRGDDARTTSTTWGELAAWALARGHANAGDPAAIAGYLGPSDEFARAVGGFATTYADQTERDYETFLGRDQDGPHRGPARCLTTQSGGSWR